MVNYDHKATSHWSTSDKGYKAIHLLKNMQKFNISNIPFSNKDKHYKIKLPTQMSLELAELIGIVVGDGHIGLYKRNHENRSHYRINICGNIKDEKHIDYTNSLFYSVFGVKLNKLIIKNKNAIELQKQSKAVCLFFKNIINIPNNKRNITIPKCILAGSSKIKALFIRGLADADFCLTIKYKPNSYPVIQGGFKSKTLTEESSKILKELSIKNYVRKEAQYYKKRDITYTIHKIYINGFKRVGEFMEVIGFNNENKSSKYTQALEQRNLKTMKHIPKKFL
ncbi:hypothetical protein HOC01_05345 [archaeon]|jgi:hypothetical protein|nr:hypothetical protein [archaeon]MBT6697734.1 hypothetical protein [archaeon]